MDLPQDPTGNKASQTAFLSESLARLSHCPGQVSTCPRESQKPRQESVGLYQVAGDARI